MTVTIALSFLGYVKTGKFSWGTVGVYYILMSMVFHYFIYEIRNPNEYYFYYNMGLNRYILWGANLFLSLIIGIILTIVCVKCM